MRQSLCSMVLVSITATAQAAHPVDGVWILERIVEETAAPLTPAGAAVQQAYDLLEDDPSLRCEPASMARVWGNPNSRTGIRVAADHVQLEHELFDLRRSIPGEASGRSGETLNLAGTAFATMGKATYRLDGERLIVTSSGLAAGFLRTGTGYPQGEGASATETFWREGDHLLLELVYRDPALFDGEYRILHRLFATGETEVPVYECTDADYDWFEQLNAEATQGEQP
jgi:hypothetical protein